MKGLLGKKIGMSQIFDEKGRALPVTIIKAGPCTITQIKTVKKDGYNALQLGMEEIENEKRLNKPLKGHFSKEKVPPHKILKELRIDNVEEYKLGEKLTVSIFEVGERVDIVGTSKGKGFAGVMKRWGFAGGVSSHGSMFKRKPASGGCTDNARTIRGKKGPGRLGGGRVTTQGVKVLKIYSDNNLILVKGCVPGVKNGLLLIKNSIKS